MAEEIPAKPEAQPEKDSGGVTLRLQWGVLLVALALALISSAYVGYRVYLETTQVDPLEELRGQVRGQLAEQGERLVDLRRTLSEADARQSNAAVMIEDELATLSGRLDETVRMVVEAAAPDEREWKLAEVEYLLRIANHRVTMEQDIRGALQLTVAADAVLESLDDFSMHEVRAQLAREISALKMVPGLDVTGIYVRIDALSEHVGQLQTRRPWAQAQSSEDPAETVVEEAERSVWAMLAERLSLLVRIQVADALPRRPQLSEEEVQYVHQLLRLQLEQAKLGLLRKDQTLYTGNLSSTATWVREYFDPQTPASVMVLDELAALAAIQLTADIPDISGSSNLLRGLRRLEEG
ncbi:MAG: uroporphyrinogen-III C-methyltransferase [Gammaproteobacteria bacterium]|nr:uroporphyrinogen-III C-methyltransferase [Gammaproteobacteria bacterium]